MPQQPSATAKGKASLAKFAQVTARQNLAQRGMREKLEQLDREIAARENTLAQLERNAERERRWWTRHGRTVARVALVPLLVLAAAPLMLVVQAVVVGEIERTSGLLVLRRVDPLFFWLSVLEPASMAVLFGYPFYRALLGSKIFSRGET